MPIYEFECGDCGRESEVLVRSTDWDGTPCPHCGSRRLKKKLSVFAAGAGSVETADGPVCSGDPGSCGRCGGGFPPD